MPVSGKEEFGVKPVAWQSSDSNAGVPIKKRRFPLVRPPSPPSEAQPSPQARNELPQKENTNSGQESSLSNASIASGFSGLTDMQKNSFIEEKGGSLADTDVDSVQSDANFSRVKLQEPSLTIFSGFLDVADSKARLMAAEKSACPIITGSTELQLAPSKALTLNVGKELFRKPKVEEDCKPEFSGVPGNTALSLGLKEPPVPALAGPHSEANSQMSEMLDPFSLNLSLSKGKAIAQCKNDEIASNNNCTHHCANRSNWDLNTTMDTWVGPERDATAGEKTIGLQGFNTAGGIHDVNPLICSTGMMAGGSVVLGKRILEESEPKSNIPISTPIMQQCEPQESLHLHLSPSCLQTNFNLEQSGSSAKLDSGRVFHELGLSAGNLNRVGCKAVKPEPFDDSAKENSNAAQARLIGLIDFRTVKLELVEKWRREKSSNLSVPKLIDHRFIKSEPVHVGNQETCKTTEGTSHQPVLEVVKCMDTSCVLPTSIALQMPCSSGFPTCSTDLSKSDNVLGNVEISAYCGEAPREACTSVEPVTSDMVSVSVGHDGKESNVSDGVIDNTRAEDLNVVDPELCRSKSMDVPPLDSQGNGEGSVSDEEKINISADMLEDDSYDSDYDSDGNHALATVDTEDKQYGGEDDDYEDGEVREPLVHTPTEDPICEKREAEDVNHGDSDNRMTDFPGSPGEVNLDSSQIEEKDMKLVETSETNYDHSKESAGTVIDEKTDQGTDKEACLQESCPVEMQTVGTDKKRSVKAIRRKPLDRSVRKDEIKGHDAEPSSDQVTNGSQGTAAIVGQGVEENVKGTDAVEKNDSTLPKTEASLKGDDTAKDSNSGGNRSRIINLSRPSSLSSSYKTRSIPGRSLPSRTGRERFTDFVLEGDKLHPQGSRDELYIDGPRKFLRERNQEQSLRNSRLNIVRGRGRVSSRLDPARGDWDSDRDFAPEFYNGRTDFRFPRHKHASDVADVEPECDSYIVPPDGILVGTGRGGRKALNNEVTVFHHPSSRRRSPGGGEVQATRGVPMVRRIPRNISPGKCIREDGSDVVGLRHAEKFMRGLPDDIMNPMFARSQPPYEGVEGHFIRGSRDFPSVHRRGFHRIRSRSPVRPRTRSPGPWSSLRRRSPDAFNGHPELTHRSSPAIYRMERMRSPDRSCFPGDIVARRHGSPPYMSRPSNDLRDIDSGRDHGHPRSVIFNRRSPSGRVLPRSTRRFDIIDPRERTDNDEYFGAPVHTGRFHELSGDASGDERRKYGERRGPRSFRAPYAAAEGENYRFHLEDGPRPFSFCPEADPDFQERGNLREREFDRRSKNRLGNAPMGTRSIEDEEGNYRHGGQVWHDDVFDDVPRGKRRRF